MVVEQLQGSGLRARTAFLVLTQTLLQGLGQQSDTHHLVTAQRIYTCLERHLLEASSDGKGVSWITWCAAAIEYNFS